MKEARGKYGGSFMGTMVRYWMFDFFISNLCFVIGLSQLAPSCTSHHYHFIQQLERRLKLGILILRLQLSG